MKIVYLFNPSYDERNINFYNLGLISIASHLKRKGIPTHVYMNYLDKEFTRDKDYDLVLESILKEEPLFIGISCMTTQYMEALDLAQRIKSINSDIPIVFGGAHVNAYSQELLDKHQEIDYCVTGFGETISEMLCTNLTKPFYRKLRLPVKGMPLLKVYNEPLDFSTVVHYKPIERLMRGRTVKQASIMTSYGCPYSCRFCVNVGSPIIYRNTEAVLQEIEQVLDMGADSIFFCDELLFLKPERIDTITNDFPWIALARIDSPLDNLKHFRDKGCEELHFGVESGSQRVIDKCINKKIKVKNVIPVFQKVLDADIMPRASFIIGMPGETIEDVCQTIWLIMEMAERFGNRFVVNAFFFYPIPNTPMTDEAFKGLTSQDCIDAARLAVHPYNLFKHFSAYDFLPDKKFFAECWYVARVISEICAPYKYYKDYKPDFNQWGLSVSDETYKRLNKDKLSQKWLNKVRRF